MNKPFSFIIISILIFIYSSGCIDTKSATYFNNASSSSFSVTGDQSSWLIQKHDILNISISSLNQEASQLFNQTNGPRQSATDSYENKKMAGYMVDQDGFIQLPLLGKIIASGIEKKELQEKVKQLLIEQKLLIDPIVDVRNMNFEITVIGEVGHPNVITVQNENISLMKAIGMAGDITPYGKKNNVLLIREVNGIRQIIRINLNDRNFLNSPYYYLKPNDIIYVESNKNRIASVGRGRQLMPAILSGISVLVIVIDRLL